MADRRTITLRYDGKCANCGTTLPAKTQAIWDRVNKAAFCVTCPGHGPTAAESAEGPPLNPHLKPVPASEAPPAVPMRPDAVAGGSAQAEADRRHRKREEKIDATWGRLAGVVKFLSDDPQSTRAWSRGAEGERQLAVRLDRFLGDRAVLLYDRKVGRANIDIMAVASSGVWVIDAKLYKGQVAYRNNGGLFGPANWQILIGGRDKTKLAEGLGWQVDAVRKALGPTEVPVHPVLCFVAADWGWFAKPFRHQGVLVTWSKDLSDRIAAPGPLGPDQIQATAAKLSAALRPATRRIESP